MILAAKVMRKGRETVPLGRKSLKFLTHSVARPVFTSQTPILGTPLTLRGYLTTDSLVAFSSGVVNQCDVERLSKPLQARNGDR